MTRSTQEDVQNLYTKHKYNHILVSVPQGVLDPELRMEQLNGRTQKTWFHNSSGKRGKNWPAKTQATEKPTWRWPILIPGMKERSVESCQQEKNSLSLQVLL